MSYILMIWTTVAMAAAGSSSPTIAYSWRPLGEFYQTSAVAADAREKCEAAARQLGMKTGQYQCVKNR